MPGMRVSRACALLARTSKPVAEIAYELGFEDQLHFSRRFRQFIGQPPTAYRRSHQMG